MVAELRPTIANRGSLAISAGHWTREEGGDHESAAVLKRIRRISAKGSSLQSAIYTESLSLGILESPLRWKHPHDPDSRVAKMKDGRTHLAHKAEHAVDLDTGALLAVTLPAADQGDITTVGDTFNEAQRRLQTIRAESAPEIVADKGYHSDAVLEEMEELGIRTYIAEPERGRRTWTGKVAAQKRLYANRRRLRGARSKRLHRKRAELTERTFAHMYETGGMRRLHLRSSQNILKRLLVQGAAFNLGLLMRKRHGIGKPKQPKRPERPILPQILTMIARVRRWYTRFGSHAGPHNQIRPFWSRSLSAAKKLKTA